MTSLLNKYVVPPTTVYDIGSFDVNGSYKELVNSLGHAYVGVDIEPGPNVDTVIPELGPWNLKPTPLIISGSCLEHVKQPWEWIKEARKACSDMIIIIAPFTWVVHKHPVDCWRFLPDGMESLLAYGGFQPIASDIVETDCYCVGKIIAVQCKGE
jgi:hypothetical protein